MPSSRPQTPQDQQPALLRALLPSSLSEQEVSLRVARLSRRLNAASAGGGGGGLTKNWQDVQADYGAVVQKQRIMSADPTLPDELVRSWRHLVDLPQFRENKPQHDVQDSEITREALPAHLTFLVRGSLLDLALAQPPTSATQAIAHSLLAQHAVPPPSDRALWDEFFKNDLSNETTTEPKEDDWVEPDWGSNASDISWDDDLSFHGVLSSRTDASG